MSGDEGEGGGSDYDEDAPDQEEIMIDNELDDDINIQNDAEVEERECRLKINQVAEAKIRKSVTAPVPPTHWTARTIPLATSCDTR
jgi:hypothetical protein